MVVVNDDEAGVGSGVMVIEFNHNHKTKNKSKTLTQNFNGGACFLGSLGTSPRNLGVFFRIKGKQEGKGPISYFILFFLVKTREARKIAGKEES